MNLSTRLPTLQEPRSRTEHDTALNTWDISQMSAHLGGPRVLMKSESEMPDTYLDFIREEGAPSILRRDNSQIQSGTRTTKLNQQYFI